MKPLTCPGCGAPVPLGESDRSLCKGCGSEVDVPADYAAMRASSRLDADTRAKAAAMAAELSGPPSLAMRLWMTAGTWTIVWCTLALLGWLLVSAVMCFRVLFTQGLDAGLAALAVGLFLGIPLLYNEWLHDHATQSHVDRADTWGVAGADARLGLVFFIIVAMPLILSAYADGFESARATLRRLLAAKQPKTKGGTLECRTCGDPLDVAAGALHARCVYCRSDNLLDVPPELLEAERKDSKRVVSDLADALVQQASAKRDGRRLVLVRVAMWLALFPAILVGLGGIVAALNADGAPFWRAATPTGDLRPKDGKNPVLSRNRATVFDVQKTFDQCDDEDCVAYYFAPLQYRETIALDVERGDLRLVTVEKLECGTWYNPTYGWKHVDMTNGAPFSGWFRVGFATQRHGKGPAPIVRWTTTRR